MSYKKARLNMFTYSDFVKYQKSAKTDFCPFSDHADVYSVTVNGKKVPVYSCTISKYPFNKRYNGFQRSEDQTETAYFVNIIGDGLLNFTVKSKRKIEFVKLKPYASQIKPKVSGNDVSFTIDKIGQYVLHVNGSHSPLYVFYSEEYKLPPEGATYVVKPGIKRQDFVLKSGESLYIDKDAYVYGNVFVENAENVRIFGNGIMDDGYEARGLGNCYCLGENIPSSIGNLKLYNAKNVTIEGVGFVNSACYALNCECSENIFIKDVKVFGQWRYNTDGIDFMNCRNVTVKDSFVSVFDDCLCVKGISNNTRDSYGFLFENIILSNDWGRACEIGLETFADQIYDVTYKNVHVIKCDDVAFDIQNGDFAHVHDVKYIDCVLECESYYTPHQLQTSFDEKYSKENEINVVQLFNAVNYRMLGSINADEIYNWNYDVYKKGANSATISDVLMENVKVYYDEKIGMENGAYKLPVLIDSVVKNRTHKNIKLKNVTVNGEKLNYNNVVLSISFAENFTIE